MDAKNKLLDKARGFCSPPTDKALAERMAVSRTLLSRWRNGYDPMKADRVTQLCGIAHEDASGWLVLIEAEQSTGATRRAWEKLAHRLGLAASLFLVLAAPGMTSQKTPDTAYYVHLSQWWMRFRRSTRRLLSVSLNSAHECRSAAMLA